MNHKPDREAATETMLRRALMNPARDAAGASCVDAETAAAWFEQSLTPDEQAAVEVHVSQCARCRAMVALLARTAPAPEARPWWRQMSVRWLVPAGAVVATATAIWIAIDVRSQVERPAPSESSAAMPANDAQAKVKEVEPAPTEARESKPAAAEEPSRLRPLEKSAKQERKSLQAKADSERSRQESARANAPELADERAQSKPATAAGAAADAVAPRPMDRVGGVAGGVPAPPAAPQGAASAPPPAARRLDRFSEAVAVAGVGAGPDITSPDPSSRWRVETFSTVSRSTDGGQTWTSQSTGLSAMLTAGASPAPTVCWMVGRAGVIILTTDGRTWQRVPFPEAVDLRSVSATSAEAATVTTADNRTFSTINGGGAWTPR